MIATLQHPTAGAARPRNAAQAVGNAGRRAHTAADARLQYLDSLAKESSGDPSLQRELAMAYEKVGDVQGWDVRSNLGDTAGALQSYEKSHVIREALVAANPKDERSRADLAETYNELGPSNSRWGSRMTPSHGCGRRLSFARNWLLPLDRTTAMHR